MVDLAHVVNCLYCIDLFLSKRTGLFFSFTTITANNTLIISGKERIHLFLRMVSNSEYNVMGKLEIMVYSSKY